MGSWFLGRAFSIQISKHTFFSESRGFIFSQDALRLEDAEAMGLKGAYVYALSYGFAKDDCFVQLCPIDRPMSPEAFLKLAWKKASILCEKPEELLLHKAVPEAFPFLEAHLGKIGIPSRGATRADTSFNGVYRSMALRGYHEFLWSDVKFRPDLSSFETANEFLVKIQDVYREHYAVRFRGKRAIVPFEPANWRIESKVVPERLRALLDDGQIRIAPTRLLVLALKDPWRCRDEPWHFNHYSDVRKGREEIYFVAGRGEVERKEFEAFRKEQRATLDATAPRTSEGENAKGSSDQNRVRSSKKKRGDEISAWVASTPVDGQSLVRRHAGRVWNIWPTGVSGFAQIAGTTKKEMNWFLNGQFALPWPKLEALARALLFDPKKAERLWHEMPLVMKAGAEGVIWDFLCDMVRFPHLYCEILPQRGQVDPVWRMMLVWHADQHRSSYFPALPYVLLFDCDDGSEEESIVPEGWSRRMREQCGAFGIPGKDYREILQECIDFCADPVARLDPLREFWIGKQDLLHAIEDESAAYFKARRRNPHSDELYDY